MYIKPDIERQRTIFLTGMTPEQIQAENNIRERLILVVTENAGVIPIDKETMLGYETINNDYRVGIKYPLQEIENYGGFRLAQPMEL